MTNIAICGACGKMGRVINDIISQRDDCTTVAGVDKVAESYADFPVVGKISEITEKPDVIIDFSHPSLLDDLLDYCMTNGVAAVIATTGYSDEQIEKIHKAAAVIAKKAQWKQFFKYYRKAYEIAIKKTLKRNKK